MRHIRWRTANLCFRCLEFQNVDTVIQFIYIQRLKKRDHELHEWITIPRQMCENEHSTSICIQPRHLTVKTCYKIMTKPWGFLHGGHTLRLKACPKNIPSDAHSCIPGRSEPSMWKWLQLIVKIDQMMNKNSAVAAKQISHIKARKLKQDTTQ